MTDQQPSPDAPSVHAGAPFGVMLQGALVPSLVAGALAVVGVVLWRGTGAFAGAMLGLMVSVAFFAAGMLLLSRLVRTANPTQFFAIAMTVYLGQVIGLLLFIIGFHNRDWVDGRALGIVAFVVTIAWQVFAMRAFRHARVPVYDIEGPS